MEISAETAGGRYSGRAFYPFTFPITSGPATVVIKLTHRLPSLAESVLAYTGIFAAVLAVGGCVYVYYAYQGTLPLALVRQDINVVNVD